MVTQVPVRAGWPSVVAVTAIEGDHSFGVDFAQRTAVGLTNAVFPLGALLRAVLPLISNLEDEERAALRVTLESRSLADDETEPVAADSPP